MGQIFSHLGGLHTMPRWQWALVARLRTCCCPIYWERGLAAVNTPSLFTGADWSRINNLFLCREVRERKRNRVKPMWAIFMFYLLGIAMRQAAQTPHNRNTIQHQSFLSKLFQYLELLLHYYIWNFQWHSILPSNKVIKCIFSCTEDFINQTNQSIFPPSPRRCVRTLRHRMTYEERY